MEVADFSTSLVVRKIRGTGLWMRQLAMISPYRKSSLSIWSSNNLLPEGPVSYLTAARILEAS